MEKNCVLCINGGIGKELCATTLVRYLKEKGFNKITTISGVPEVFVNNPNVDRNLHVNTSYVEDDYIKGSELYQGEPYALLDYREGKKHLNQVFPLAYRFQEDNLNIHPEIFSTPDEEKEIQKMISQAPKPVITVQFQGGPVANQQGQPVVFENTRNLNQHQGQLIVDTLVKEGFSVIQLRSGNQFMCKGAQVFNLMPRAYMIMGKFIKGHIGIDSFMNHVAGAWKKPALIFWNSTHYKNLGYPTSTNIFRDKCPTPMCNRPRVGYADVVPGGIWQCPHRKICQEWTDEEIIKHVTEFCKQLKAEVDNSVNDKICCSKNEGEQRQCKNINQ